VTEAISPHSLARAIIRSRLLFRLSTRSDAQGGVRVVGWRIIALHLPFLAAVLLAGVVDGTLYLPGAGHGVLNHYGFQAILLSTPFLAWMLCAFVIKLASIIAEPRWFAGHDKTAEAAKLQHELIEFVLGRGRGAVLLALIRSVGILAVISNASTTRYPELYYGQDVFDSFYHPVGYVVGRIFLAYCWAYGLPLLAYFIIMATVSTVRITKIVEHSNEHDLRCFAADGCSGFRVLGSLMNSIVIMFVPISLCVVALSHTHANFYPLLKLSIVLALLIPAQLVLPFIRLHRVMVLLKRRKLLQIEKMLTAAESALPEEPPRGWESRFIAPYLRLLAGASLYQQASEMSTWPYVRADALKWVTPFVPLVVSTWVKKYVP